MIIRSQQIWSLTESTIFTNSLASSKQLNFTSITLTTIVTQVTTHTHIHIIDTRLTAWPFTAHWFYILHFTFEIDRNRCLSVSKNEYYFRFLSFRYFLFMKHLCFALKLSLVYVNNERNKTHKYTHAHNHIKVSGIKVKTH